MSTTLVLQQLTIDPGQDLGLVHDPAAVGAGGERDARPLLPAGRQRAAEVHQRPVAAALLVQLGRLHARKLVKSTRRQQQGGVIKRRSRALGWCAEGNAHSADMVLRQPAPALAASQPPEYANSGSLYQKREPSKQEGTAALLPNLSLNPYACTHLGQGPDPSPSLTLPGIGSGP